mmetsp:Transcript_134472/g.429545  ORF Transcript_134472/g.429545 Transcript_134472/m.429545 type:complete len:84 (+) Transcript_134472:192-443(+)
MRRCGSAPPHGNRFGQEKSNELEQDMEREESYVVMKKRLQKEMVEVARQQTCSRRSTAGQHHLLKAEHRRPAPVEQERASAEI